jgi:hypothetical protein
MSLNHHVGDRLGELFEEVFLPDVNELVQPGPSYDEVGRD